MNAEISPLILCSTARLARSLQLADARKQQAVSSKQWQALPVITLSGWLDDWVEQALLAGNIVIKDAPRGALSTMQERLLWEQAIESTLKNLDNEPLFDKVGLASAAQEANRLLIEWNLSLPVDDMTEETRQFLLWRQRFQSLCKHSGWLEPMRYLSWQLQCIESGAGTLPEQIAMAGFDRISPQLQRLIDALKARGVKVEPYNLAFTVPQPASHIPLPDQDTECRAAAAWAHGRLMQNSDSRLAIVVPDLAALRARLSALMDETFEPALVMPQLAEVPRNYDFSLGQSLTTQPIISDALALLRFGMQRQSVPQADFSALLHSPYWSASFKEADARARLDVRLRERLPLHVRPARLLKFIDKSADGQYALPLDKTKADLHELFRSCQAQPARLLPSAWTAAYRMILKSTHWPGERTVSSHEYQAIQSLDRVYKSFAQLDSVLNKISAGEALKRFTQLCKEQIFQPEAEASPQLQIMGMLEAVAEPLDAIWVMGMNDHVWPPPPHPNPLLPASLQRSAATPNADSAAQAAFAEVIHQRLLRSAKQVIFSSSQKDGERQLRASPLMLAIPKAQGEFAIQPTLAETLASDAATGLQLVEDHQAPAITEGQHIGGGTGLLKAQAICPAWAFYQYRLYARALKTPVNGLDAMERGTLVHAALEFFWEGRGSQDIHGMSGEVLQEAVSTAAELALERFSSERELPFSPAFHVLECGRLTKLVLTWLTEVEMQRPQPFTVTACEQKQMVMVEGVSITLVVDRIDILDDGRLIVMDYKTGQRNKYNNWADVRITEPQLPIYTAFVLAADGVAVVCFAEVRMDKSGFAGIASEAGLVQGAAALYDTKARKIFPESEFPDWLTLLAEWKSRIESIACELKSGEAAVRFASKNDLVYCEVLPLLRLPERQLQFERMQVRDGQAYD